MNHFVSEYSRYYELLKKSLEQTRDEEFFEKLTPSTNSIAIILKHLAGNLRSRFSDFLNSDGEKPWRDRDSEFVPDGMTREEIERSFDEAWEVLKDNVWQLGQSEMKRQISIRAVEFTVEEALVRSLAHFSHHVGEILFIARYYRGDDWQYLSVAPGQSAAYNKNPTREKINLD